MNDQIIKAILEAFITTQPGTLHQVGVSTPSPIESTSVRADPTLSKSSSDLLRRVRNEEPNKKSPTSSSGDKANNKSMKVDEMQS